MPELNDEQLIKVTGGTGGNTVYTFEDNDAFFNSNVLYLYMKSEAITTTNGSQMIDVFKFDEVQKFESTYRYIGGYNDTVSASNLYALTKTKTYNLYSDYNICFCNKIR